jgi:hypothetical protein
MNARKFTFVIFWSIVISIIGLFILVIVLSLPDVNGFDMDRKTPGIFKAFLPFMTTYLGIVTAFIIRHRNNAGPARRKLSRHYVWYTAVLLGFHFCLLVALLLLAAYSRIHFDQFIWLTRIVETAFGASIILVIRNLFQVPESAVTRSGNSSPD